MRGNIQKEKTYFNFKSIERIIKKLKKMSY